MGCNSFSSDSIDFNENRVVQPHGRVVTLNLNGPLGDNILRFFSMRIINRRCISVDYLPHTSHLGICQEILTLKPSIKPLTEACVKKVPTDQLLKITVRNKKTAHNLSKQLWNAEVTSSRCDACCDWLTCSMLWYSGRDWLKHFTHKGLFTQTERISESEKDRNSSKKIMNKINSKVQRIFSLSGSLSLDVNKT